MKNQQLQTKRQTKKGLRKLHAKVSTTRRKQRVSASANPEMLDSDVPNASIGRALTVILILHVVAIGAVYIGVQWSKGKNDIPDTAAASSSTVDISNVNAGGLTAFAIVDDTYASFAARHNADEAEVRKLNGNAIIHAGKRLAYRPVAQANTAAAVAALPVSERPPLPTTNTVVHIETPRAEIVRPAVGRAVPVATVSGQTYKVKAGDSIWRISKKYNVSQAALLKLNNMKDARKLRSGMTLQIPAQ